MIIMDVIKKAAEHWEYVKSVIEMHEQADMEVDLSVMINTVGFHYKTAMEHGYKHGLEEGYKQGIEAARKVNII